MAKSYQLALHVFRRDLRLQDNTALIQALSEAEQVIPCFIFDSRQIQQNDYKSDHSLQFMAQSLRELNTQLQEKHSQLYFFYGIAEEIIAQLLTTLPIQAVYLNRDYTPFSILRDRKIAALCEHHRVDFNSYADALLHEPEQVAKADHTPYTVFTPFMKRARELFISVPQKNNHDNYYQRPIAQQDMNTLPKLLKLANPNLFVKGGRTEAYQLLKGIKELTDYEQTRDFPALNATSKLSAHNKFGTLSIREVYAVIQKYLSPQHALVNELYWRDFFTHICFHFPRVLGQAFHEKYADIPWSQNEQHFRAWCEGRTGFPIVDAGMRELNTTGFMHNRVRMITASFLTKDLHIDWQWGEKYFAQKLVDYDPAVNNGNWQWAASTGCDAQPYFRIFNPWLQQQKFDPDCLYVKRWIPELARIPNKIVHELYKKPDQLMTNYPHVMIDHQKATQLTKKLYQG